MIASAKQDGSTVRVYNEKGSQLFSKTGILVGFTSSTVSIKDKSGSTVRTFNEKGGQLFSK